MLSHRLFIQEIPTATERARGARGGLIKNYSDQLVHRGYAAHGSVAVGPVYIYDPT